MPLRTHARVRVDVKVGPHKIGLKLARKGRKDPPTMRMLRLGLGGTESAPKVAWFLEHTRKRMHAQVRIRVAAYRASSEGRKGSQNAADVMRLASLGFHLGRTELAPT